MSGLYWTPLLRGVPPLSEFRKAAPCLSSTPPRTLSELLRLYSMGHMRGGHGLLTIRSASPRKECKGFWRHSKETGVCQLQWKSGAQACWTTKRTNSGGRRIYDFAASPGAAISVMRMNMEIDVRHVLPAIRTPTLILHRTGDRLTPVDQARHMAKDIRGAKLVELPGNDHTPWVGDTDALLDEIEEFLTGIRHGPEPDRILATVLFTDIVGSTKRAVELGDRDWRELLEQHHAIVRRQLARFRGREVDKAGDGFLATFDGPGRAIRCAVTHLSAGTLAWDRRQGWAPQW